jgi:hypothetical protein
MADPAEFSPADLDHLEDGLEGLEFAPPARETAPHVRRRLEDYRNILALSRAAMPMVEVPRGLLDDVLAQARASAEVPSITPVAAVPPPRPGFWARVRRFGLLPGVALAGTAAIVMLMVERDPKVESGARVADDRVVAKPAVDGRARAAEAAPAASAEPPSPVAAEANDRSDALAGKTAEPITTPGAAPPASKPAENPSPEAPASPVSRKGMDKKEDLGVVEESEKSGGQAEAKLADAEMARWDTIARGDRKRHRGECGEARNEYTLALDDVDARVRARAHAGLGLCDAMRGDRSSADAAYKVARELDAEIAGFIDNERARGSGAAPAKAKPKAAKSKVVDEPPPQTGQNDPFE